ncbi:MAG TPA: carboxyl transferase [Ruminococcaceae bacterium]|nr:carboxyl transferase [Oscillospiraceae bacterium]
MSFAGATQKLSEHTAAKNCAAYKRLEQLFDEGSLRELDPFVKNENQTAEVFTAYGTVDGCPAYAFSQNTEIFSGAMGKVQAAKIRRVYELAEKTGVPVVGIYDSKGAHLNEGADAMGAFGELIRLSNNLSGVVPQISLVLGTCAGSSAILATSADFVIVSGKSELFLNSPFVLGDKSGKSGSPETVYVNGIAQLYQKDEAQAITKARTLITLLPQNNLAQAPLMEQIAPAGDAAALNAKTPALDTVIDAIADADSKLTLSKAYAPCVQTLLARIGGASCGIVATNPAADSGRLNSDGCVKIARFVRMCDAFSIPVITLIDSVGFAASSEAEISGNVRDAALLAHAYAEATTVKISLITGAAYGSVYILLAGRASASDAVLAWPQAVISALNPEASAAILMHGRLKSGETQDKLTQEYIDTQASAFAVAAMGYIDDVIEPAATRDKIYAALDMLAGKRVSTMSKKHSNMPL